MESKTRTLRRVFVDADFCAACGCCAKVCPLNAIAVFQGTTARVDRELCVG